VSGQEGQSIYTFLQLNQFEYASGVDSRPVKYDAQGWIGGDYNRFWFRLEGDEPTRGDEVGETEIQALFSRLVSPFWDLQTGVRLDVARTSGDAETRFYWAVGLEGLAPYWFEVSSSLFVSEDGEFSARLEASYDLLFTQRLIVEPEIELNAAFQDVADELIGSGLNDFEFGFRMRYEIRREFAPYIGFSWTRRTGETADLFRDAGLSTRSGGFVAGIRAWY